MSRSAPSPHETVARLACSLASALTTARCRFGFRVGLRAFLTPPLALDFCEYPMQRTVPFPSEKGKNRQILTRARSGYKAVLVLNSFQILSHRLIASFIAVKFYRVHYIYPQRYI